MKKKKTTKDAGKFFANQILCEKTMFVKKEEATWSEYVATAKRQSAEEEAARQKNAAAAAEMAEFEGGVAAQHAILTR